MQQGAVVTSTTGGRHNPGSAHPKAERLTCGRRSCAGGGRSPASSSPSSNFLVRDERQRPAGQEVWSGEHLHIETGDLAPLRKVHQQLSQPRGPRREAQPDPFDWQAPTVPAINVSGMTTDRPGRSAAPPATPGRSAAPPPRRGVPLTPAHNCGRWASDCGCHRTHDRTVSSRIADAERARAETLKPCRMKAVN